MATSTPRPHWLYYGALVSPIHAPDEVWTVHDFKPSIVPGEQGVWTLTVMDCDKEERRVPHTSVKPR